MAKVIGLMGDSGSGKTTSLKGLDPATTFIIDADKKGLNWRGWRDQYSAKAGNYIRTDDPELIKQMLYKINLDESMLATWCKKNQKAYAPIKPETREAVQKIKTVVIDTLNGVMVGCEMRNIQAKGYQKWTDLAETAWDILDYCLTMRDDLVIVINCHSETISDDNGVVFTRIKTNGRKLEKLVLESKMTTVVYAKNTDDGYKFFTRMKDSTCKTPLDSFEDESIPNDITLVIKALEDY